MQTTSEKDLSTAISALMLATNSAHTREEVIRSIIMLYLAKVINGNGCNEISLTNAKMILLGDERQEVLFLPTEAVNLIRSLIVSEGADETHAQQAVIKTVSEILDGHHLLDALDAISVYVDYARDDDQIPGSIYFRATTVPD